MKIYFMLAYTHAKADRPEFAEVMANLSAEGFDVTAGVAESLAISPEDLRVEADLYILKSNSSLWLNLASVLDSQGARILNPFSACVTTINKIRTAACLASAAVPIPRSWVTGDLAKLAKVAETMPLIIKPNIGHGGSGIRIIRDRSELEATPIEDGMFVQEFITPAEDELKLYVIGERVFGIRKNPASGERISVVVEPMLEDVALRCSRALGLEICGVDVLITPNGPVVIDVNYFPSFRSVPGVARPLTDFIRDYAQR